MCLVSGYAFKAKVMWYLLAWIFLTLSQEVWYWNCTTQIMSWIIKQSHKVTILTCVQSVFHMKYDTPFPCIFCDNTREKQLGKHKKKHNSIIALSLSWFGSVHLIPLCTLFMNWMLYVHYGPCQFYDNHKIIKCSVLKGLIKEF